MSRDELRDLISETVRQTHPVSGMERWKWLTGILGAVLITGAGSWFTFGGGIDRDAAEKMIESHTKTMHPQAVSRHEFDLLREDLSEIKTDLRDLKATMNALLRDP